MLFIRFIRSHQKSVIDWYRIPNDYKTSTNDYEYDEINATSNGFESLSSTR